MVAIDTARIRMLRCRAVCVSKHEGIVILMRALSFNRPLEVSYDALD
jgi:hypothetical protein